MVYLQKENGKFLVIPMEHIHEKRAQFSDLYEKEVDAVFRFCLMRVSDREHALDITQDAFARVWNMLKKGTEIGNVRAYVYRTAHNLIVNWYMEKKPIPLSSLEADPESGEAFEPASLDDGALFRTHLETEGRFLVSALSKLNPSYRLAVYLRYVEGLSPPEVAEALNITANAASIRIARGLAELRKITGYDYEQ